MDATDVLNIALWTAQGFLALFFLAAGAPKLLGRGIEKWTGFSELPRAQVVFTGFAEVLGAAGLVLPLATGVQPWLTPLAAVGLAVIDVSFISLTLVLPSVLRFLDTEASLIALVKPQFEVGRGRVGRGGIVRDDRQRLEATNKILQFAEGLSDRQAADAVRSRIDWKYALSLELPDPGFDHTVLSEFRTRLVAGHAEQLLLDTLLQGAPMGILLLNEADRVVYANVAARRLLGEGRRLVGKELAALAAGSPNEMRRALLAEQDTLFTVPAGEGAEEETYRVVHRRFQLNTQEHRMVVLERMTPELRRQEVEVWKKVIRVMSHELNNSVAPISSPHKGHRNPSRYMPSTSSPCIRYACSTQSLYSAGVRSPTMSVRPRMSVFRFRQLSPSTAPPSVWRRDSKARRAG